jgi:hypothetical protein
MSDENTNRTVDKSLSRRSCWGDGGRGRSCSDFWFWPLRPQKALLIAENLFLRQQVLVLQRRRKFVRRGRAQRISSADSRYFGVNPFASVQSRHQHFAFRSESTQQKWPVTRYRGSAINTASAFAARLPEGLSPTASLAKIQFSSHVISQSPLTEILRL